MPQDKTFRDFTFSKGMHGRSVKNGCGEKTFNRNKNIGNPDDASRKLPDAGIFQQELEIMKWKEIFDMSQKIGKDSSFSFTLIEFLVVLYSLLDLYFPLLLFLFQ